MIKVSKLIITILGIFFSLFADGSLTVRTEPEGVEVWINDNFVGDSPIIEKKLKPGRYNLKLIDPVQHTSMEEEIFIQDGQTTLIEKTITAKFGSLRIISQPEGAKVYISTELGETPVSNDFMNPGKYRLEIKHPNGRYQSVVKDVVIPKGEVVSLTETLKQNTMFDRKAFVRLGLGAGTVAGFVWAIVEHGNQAKFNEWLENRNDKDTKKKADSAGIRRNLGIILGSVCIVGLEIVAFF